MSNFTILFFYPFKLICICLLGTGKWLALAAVHFHGGFLTRD